MSSIFGTMVRGSEREDCDFAMRWALLGAAALHTSFMLFAQMAEETVFECWRN